MDFLESKKVKGIIIQFDISSKIYAVNIHTYIKLLQKQIHAICQQMPQTYLTILNSTGINITTNLKIENKTKVYKPEHSRIRLKDHKDD